MKKGLTTEKHKEEKVLLAINQVRATSRTNQNSVPGMSAMSLVDIPHATSPMAFSCAVVIVPTLPDRKFCLKLLNACISCENK